MVQEERCLLKSFPTLGAGVQSPTRGQPMTTGNCWPAWLRRHKIVTALIGTTLAAASLLAVIKVGDDFEGPPGRRALCPRGGGKPGPDGPA